MSEVQKTGFIGVLRRGLQAVPDHCFCLCSGIFIDILGPISKASVFKAAFTSGVVTFIGLNVTLTGSLSFHTRGHIQAKCCKNKLGRVSVTLASLLLVLCLEKTTYRTQVQHC